MQLNQNYPWYIQTSPVFTGLYNGIYSVGKSITSFDSYKAFYPAEMVKESDPLAVLKGLKVYATMWQLPTEIAGIGSSLIYDLTSWSETYKWNGEETGLSAEWLFRYFKMKAFITQQPFSLKLIHDAFDILFGDIDHTITVSEAAHAITINVHTTNLEALSVFQGLNAVDTTFFGKPMGASITYTTI